MSKEKTLHPKAKQALIIALATVVVMTTTLFSATKLIMYIGITLSFLLSIFSIVSALVSMRLINKQELVYRGNNMAWIAFILGVLAFLSTLPFLIQFMGMI